MCRRMVLCPRLAKQSQSLNIFFALKSGAFQARSLLSLANCQATSAGKAVKATSLNRSAKLLGLCQQQSSMPCQEGFATRHGWDCLAWLLPASLPYGRAGLLCWLALLGSPTLPPLSPPRGGL